MEGRRFEALVDDCKEVFKLEAGGFSGASSTTVATPTMSCMSVVLAAGAEGEVAIV